MKQANKPEALEQVRVPPFRPAEKPKTKASTHQQADSSPQADQSGHRGTQHDGLTGTSGVTETDRLSHCPLDLSHPHVATLRKHTGTPALPGSTGCEGDLACLGSVEVFPPPTVGELNQRLSVYSFQVGELNQRLSVYSSRSES